MQWSIDTLQPSVLPASPPVLQNPENEMQPFSVSFAARVLGVMKFQQLAALE